MKVLVVSQQYWPENWRIVDICEELVKRGHQITVLTGLPNYDTGKILPEYRNKKRRCEEHNGVTIIRCHEHPRHKNVVDRFLNYYSFEHSGCRRIRSLPGDFDVVFLNGLSPIMQSLPGLEYAKIWEKKTCMYCLDLWPESLTAGGISKTGFTKPVYQHYLKLSKKIYRSCNRILVTSPLFINYLQQTCSVPITKISYLPQYAEDCFRTKSSTTFDHQTSHNFIFAGNIGKAQDISTIIKAAALIDDQSISFHVFGSGSDLVSAQNLVKKLNLKNFYFHGRRPLSDMPGIYSLATAMLISLSSDAFTSAVIPGKLQTYMAAGKPIIGACNGSAQQILIEAKCGFCSDSGDYRSLAKNIVLLSQLSAENLSIMSGNALKYSAAHFDRFQFFNRLENELSVLAKK